MIARLSLILGATALLASSATSQFLPRLPRGDAWRTLRGPSVSFVVAKAVDGTGEVPLLLDAQTPGVTRRVKWMRGGLRHFLTANYQTAEHGAFGVEAQVDVRYAGFNPFSWDLDARIKVVRSDLSVVRLGFEVKFEDRPGEQAALVPSFSGGEFVEPADSIPLNAPVDTRVGNSMQVTAYYSDDGTGMMMFATDPRGTTPKRFVYTSGRESQPEVKTIRSSMRYVLPNTNVGGTTVGTLASTRVCYYAFSPKLMRGWYPAAKYYRRWLEKNARGRGGILEKGRVETRRDTPAWMKNMDLLVTEQFGWFPQSTAVQNPLLNLTRLKSDLGAENMMVGLFFWWDRVAPLGRAGSYYPLPATASQVQQLLALGIRTYGYTNPGVFDVTNPFFASKGLATETVEDRSGAPLTFGAETLMDPSSRKIQAHWESMGEFHSSTNSMSGFFCDAPAQAGFADWRRPSGKDVGVSEASYLGYKEIVAAVQRGARKVNRDFVVSHEAAFEWLIPVANFGQGPVGVIGRAFRDEPRTRGVPFFQTVYSGYSLFWPAEEGLGWQTILFTPDPYGDLTKNAISRLLAEGVTWGGLPNHSEFVLYLGLIYNELPLPPPIKAAFLHHGNLQRNLIALRREARPWLVFGEMLNSPAAGGDMTDVIVKRPFDNQFFDQTFRKFAVPTEAYRARDGSIRIVAANGGTDAAGVDLDLRRLGLRWARAVVDVQTKQIFRADRRTGLIRVEVPGGTGRLLRPSNAR